MLLQSLTRMLLAERNVVDDIILAFQFAENDPYRAVTHNKGVMNGTISVANATGQDSRAIEAAAHAYAAKKWFLSFPWTKMGKRRRRKFSWRL